MIRCIGLIAFVMFLSLAPPFGGDQTEGVVATDTNQTFITDLTNHSFPAGAGAIDPYRGDVLKSVQSASGSTSDFAAGHQELLVALAVIVPEGGRSFGIGIEPRPPHI